MSREDKLIDKSIKIGNNNKISKSTIGDLKVNSPKEKYPIVLTCIVLPVIVGVLLLLIEKIL